MITIFAVPKPFVGEFLGIQQNAIRSWLQLRPKPEIILFGNDQKLRHLCRAFHLKQIPDIKATSQGAPRLDYLFSTAQARAKNKVLAYVNSDIILLQNFGETAQHIRSLLPHFLIVGRRFELRLPHLIKFDDPSWQHQLLAAVQKSGKLKSVAWMDYFVFPKGQMIDIPAFALGRTFWDKWLVWYTREKHYPVVDATRSITAIHQSHSYRHVAHGENQIWKGTEAQANFLIAGGWTRSLTINYANYKYREGKLIEQSLWRKAVNQAADGLKKIMDLYPNRLTLFNLVRKLKNY
ncbi:MAG: hypothetical protein ACOY0S_03060 [Patescibacteria group bacterium]